MNGQVCAERNSSQVHFIDLLFKIRKFPLNLLHPIIGPETKEIIGGSSVPREKRNPGCHSFFTKKRFNVAKLFIRPGKSMNHEKPSLRFFLLANHSVSVRGSIC